LKEIDAVIDTAEKERLPKRRDIAVAAITERVGDGKTNPGADYAIRLSRALYM
jgi:8-hydroxy-5-deazaflavin:NADPH oxidoreductase